MSLGLILKNLPQIIGVVSKVMSLVSKGISFIEIQNKLDEFDDAIEKANETKDTSDLENLFGSDNS